MLDYRQDFMILMSLLAQGFQIKASFALVFSFAHTRTQFTACTAPSQLIL